VFSEVLAMLQELPFPSKQKENPYVLEFNSHEKLKCAYSHTYFQQNYLSIYATGGPGSSVGIATDYGLDGPGSNPGGDMIFCPSRPALGPT